MTPERILSVVEFYRSFFKRTGIIAADCDEDSFMVDSVACLQHCHGMLDKIKTFVEEGRLEKAFRWLGFIQGVLWIQGMFTLKDLKEHNRPKE